jgi:polyisoprenyl-teichoic acid--peptidoglycan teichoic acid transferase
MRRFVPRFMPWLIGLMLLALGWWAYPLVGSLIRYGSLPRNLNQPMTILVMGVAPEYKYYHQRKAEDFRGLSDVNLLVRLDPIQNRVSILSVPRDIWVEIPEYGERLINHANKFGGPELAKQVFAQFAGVPIDAYIAVSVESIRQGVDALGGIDVCVEKSMQYRDTAAKLEIDLSPGCQKLNGVQAEGYLRFRHDALGDIGRVQRQQAFFQAVKQQVLSPAGLVNLPRTLAAVEASTRTDLSREQIASILGFATKQPRLVSLLTPGQFGRGWEVNKPELVKLVEQYFSQEPSPASQAALADLSGRSAVVLYAAAEEAAAVQMRINLRKLGLRVLLREIESAPPTSEVISSQSETLAQVLADTLGLPSRVSGEAALYADLAVRLGPGYQPVSAADK